MITDEELLKKAWKWREYAQAHKSGTKVGCAILTKGNHIAGGFNVEGLWMTSIHAEVAAIIRLLADTLEKGVRIAIVSNTEHFTPCGACCDWLFQFCLTDAIVLIQNDKGEYSSYKLKELMPYYPKQ